MTRTRLWHAIATIEVAGEDSGPFRLGTDAAVTIGRSDRAGLQSPSPRIEVPRELAQLRCTKSGWMLQNEGTTVGRKPKPVRVVGKDVLSPDGAVFAGGAWVLLSEGEWRLTWDVGVRVTVTLRSATEEDDMLLMAVDRPSLAPGMGTIAPDRLRLTPLQRRGMAALFAYRIRGAREPRDPYAEAARLLDPNAWTWPRARNSVKSQLQTITERINRLRLRGEGLHTLEEIGSYLIDVTQTIGPDDLEDDHDDAPLL